VAAAVTGRGFSRRTILVWVLLLVAVVALVQMDRTPTEQYDAHDHGPEGLDELPEGRFRVFAFGERQIGSVTVDWKGRHVDFARDPAGHWMQANHAHDDAHGADGHQHGADGHAHGYGPDQHWHDAEGHAHDHDGRHTETPDAAQITEQFEISARMLADRALEPDRPLAEYGLEEPEILFTFRDRLNGDPLAVLRVGDLLVTGYAYYTMLERRPGRLLLIPRYQINLLLALAFGDEAPSLVPVREDTRDGADNRGVSVGRGSGPRGA
jgi:hypothetical protein